jgi:hypothetical protein
MKRATMFAGAAITAAVLLSAATGCEDSFSPKIPFQEIPVVFCVLKASYTRLPSGQEAVVSRTYDV